MSTRDQDRAQAAYEAIEKIKAKNRSTEYGRLCLRLPALLLQNGLCQTLAFLHSKVKTDKPEYDNLLTDFSRAVDSTATKWEEFAQSARTVDVTEYQRLTRESLACAQWFKRYAEAVLKVVATDDTKGQ